MLYKWETKFNLFDKVKLKFGKENSDNGKSGTIVEIRIVETKSGDEPETHHVIIYIIYLDGYDINDPERLVLAGEENMTLIKSSEY